MNVRDKIVQRLSRENLGRRFDGRPEEAEPFTVAKMQTSRCSRALREQVHFRPHKMRSKKANPSCYEMHNETDEAGGTRPSWRCKRAAPECAEMY